MGHKDTWGFTNKNISLLVAFWHRDSYFRTMADRRKLQNYENLPHCLTQPVWDSLQHGSREKATSAVLQHAWRLGLRCPSESTFATVLNLIELSRERQQTMSSFQRYQSICSLKTQWKRYKTARRMDDRQYVEYVETLCRDPHDLQAEYFLDAFSMDGVTQCRV